ncbi:MAG: Zn-dependent hydrolase [Comamonas sp.]|nr:Zn-dependent hydrolase [Candidatus Comamonas equi]
MTCQLPIDAQRLQRHLTELASFGGSVSAGVARETLTAIDLQARHWLAARFAQRPGYAVGIDAAANLRIRRWGSQPDAPVVMTGSHLDTQPLGGWLDGAFGVMAGAEVLEALDDAGITTQHTLEVVAWTNEEGSRFSPGLMGSQAYTQPDTLKAMRAIQDGQGIDFGSACDAARQDFAQAATSLGWQVFDAQLASPVQAYIEAHIEQGPVLEREGLSLGIVQAIQGVRWYQITLTGRCAHAGTTPLEDRQDAQAKAVALAHLLYRYAADSGDEHLRVTIGRWACAPDSINTIADQVRFTVDVRHPQAQAIDEFDEFLRAHSPADIHIEQLQNKPTTTFDPALLALLESAAQQRALSHRSMVSGAFHDAMPIARVAPTAMLFAPSLRGISHHPQENTHMADLAACTQVLADALLTLAQPAP